MSDSLRDHIGLFDLVDTDRRWMVDAACRGSTANFFPKKMGERGVREAVAVCNGCPVRARCLEWAMNNNINYGIWGGLTSRGRRELGNALDYATNLDRQEHRTVACYDAHVAAGHADPMAATCETLGISRAAVYHHLRIDRIAKAQINDRTPPDDTDA